MLTTNKLNLLKIKEKQTIFVTIQVYLTLLAVILRGEDFCLSLCVYICIYTRKLNVKYIAACRRSLAVELAEPHVMSRDVAGDKWDSCRAIDCARRTDRLVLMRFVAPLSVAPPPRVPLGSRETIRISRRSSGTEEYIRKRPRRGGSRHWRLRELGNYRNRGFRGEHCSNGSRNLICAREKHVISDKSGAQYYVVCCPCESRAR